MKRLFAAALLALSVAACSRQVEVQTAPGPESSATLHVMNNLSQAVNVYVVSGGQDMFLKQVAAKAAEGLSVPGVAAGSTVNLKAVTADGTRTYTRDNVILTAMYHWEVP